MSILKDDGILKDNDVVSILKDNDGVSILKDNDGVSILKWCVHIER